MEFQKIEKRVSAAESLANHPEVSYLRAACKASPGDWFEVTGLGDLVSGMDVAIFDTREALKLALGSGFSVRPPETAAMTSDFDRAEVAFHPDDYW